MAYMRFDTKEQYRAHTDNMDKAIWGIYVEDAPDGGYWELVYFTKFLSRFLMMGVEDVLSVLDSPHKWTNEYRMYKRFQKLVDGETDSDTLHTMQIWNFDDLITAMGIANFKETYFQELV